MTGKKKPSGNDSWTSADNFNMTLVLRPSSPDMDLGTPHGMQVEWSDP